MCYTLNSQGKQTKQNGDKKMARAKTYHIYYRIVIDGKRYLKTATFISNKFLADDVLASWKTQLSKTNRDTVEILSFLAK